MKRFFFLVLFAINLIVFYRLYFKKADPVTVAGNIQFEFLRYDFGRLRPTDSAKISFRYKNLSRQLINISAVTPVCSCTVSNWSRSPVAYGETGVIEIQYDARIIGPFKREILVFFSGTKQPVSLIVTGEVKR